VHPSSGACWRGSFPEPFGDLDNPGWRFFNTPVIRPAQFLAILAALQILGGHWMVVQSVAWMGMLMEYSQSGTWEEAVSKTFDGKHPCKLCSAVQRGSTEEKSPRSPNASPKWEAVVGESWGVSEPSFRMVAWTMQHMRAPARSESPGVPPPRV
jgi:hypothetical protein